MSEHKIKKNVLHQLKSFRTYIDIGAGWGDTANPFVGMFDEIHAFEPNTNYNIEKIKKVIWHHVALGDEEKIVNLMMPGWSDNFEHGSVSLDRIEKFDNPKLISTCPMKTLDSFKIKNVDFIKIDVEQGEWEVVQGGKNTILEYRPLIMFENKRKENNNVSRWLQSIGYTVEKYKADCIAIFNDEINLK